MWYLDCKRKRFDLVAMRVGSEHVEGKAKDMRGGQEADDEEGEAWSGWCVELGTSWGLEGSLRADALTCRMAVHDNAEPCDIVFSKCSAV